MPIRYVRDVQASRQFFEILGLGPDPAQPNDYWSELPADGGSLALHHAVDGSDIELTLVTDRPLEEVVAHLDANGIAHDEIRQEEFGRSLRVTDPDGAMLQLNEHSGEMSDD
jgi:catechol 2,3-dioxygenase-like lactoylglutathione lyase family enzyme